MDLGWLAESALAPQKSKQIKVNQTYQIGLKIAKAEIQNLKNKVKKPKQNQKQIKRNKGVEQRMKRDQTLNLQSKSEKIIQKNVYKCLQKKANVYNKAQNKKKNISNLMVDFEAKSLLMNKEEKQQYEQDRSDFYSGKLAQLTQGQKKMHQNIQTENVQLSMMRENAAWQIEMLQQLKDDVEEGSNQVKVQQSYDKKLSKDQKNAYQKVINENLEQKQKLDKIRKRRQILEQQKLRKLRKFNQINQKKNQKDFQPQQNQK